MARSRGRGVVQVGLLVLGMVAFALPWRATSGDERSEPKQASGCDLPPGHPAVACSDTARSLPPGHPPIGGRASPVLPPGHPPIGGAPTARPGVVQPDLGGGSGPRIIVL
jgi:hypothetical protein